MRKSVSLIVKSMENQVPPIEANILQSLPMTKGQESSSQELSSLTALPILLSINLEGKHCFVTLQQGVTRMSWLCVTETKSKFWMHGAKKIQCKLATDSSNTLASFLSQCL